MIQSNKIRINPIEQTKRIKIGRVKTLEWKKGHKKLVDELKGKIQCLYNQ